MTLSDLIAKVEGPADDDADIFTPDGLERLIEESSNYLDDWYEARGIITVRRRYRNERDDALALPRALERNNG